MDGAFGYTTTLFEMVNRQKSMGIEKEREIIALRCIELEPLLGCFFLGWLKACVSFMSSFSCFI